MKTLTIFTPTYNRANTLPRLYESLKRQTSTDFEWLIVDDGSTDNTEEIVDEWMKENVLSMNYFKQPNGGKMRAHNKGVQMCQTELFVCIDSDDFITDTGVSDMIDCWRNLVNKEDFAGIIAYRAMKNEAGEYQVITRFPDSGPSSLVRLYETGFKGETTLVFATSVIKKYPFPEIEGEKFITESYSYDQIDQVYKYVLLDKVITFCEYMPDGYTQKYKALFDKAPKGWSMYFNQRAKFTDTYFSKRKLLYGMTYMIFARKAKLKDIYRTSALKTPLYPLFYLMSFYFVKKWKFRTTFIK